MDGCTVIWRVPWLILLVDKDIFLSAGGIDFVNLTQEVSFSQTNQTHCVDISILMDADQELNESFSVELTLQYAINLALDMYTVTIVDSSEFEVCMW